MDSETKEFDQDSAFSSPWTLKQRVAMLLWQFTWTFACIWTPKPLNAWRLFWLKRFGCKIYGRPFVHQRARIAIPWNLTMHHKACLGDRANAYTLGPIEIGARAVVAQEAYLCTGSHAFDKPTKNLIVARIVIGDDAFIGARAFILPGVTIGSDAIIGACSVVTKDVLSECIAKGNPATSRKRN